MWIDNILSAPLRMGQESYVAEINGADEVKDGKEMIGGNGNPCEWAFGRDECRDKRNE